MISRTPEVVYTRAYLALLLLPDTMDVQEGCLVLRVKDGGDRQCMLDSPENLADLIWDHVFRPRLAQNRGEKGYIPPD